MRCLVSNPKKIRRLRRVTGLPVVSALVRGNTGHRVDLKLEGEDAIYFYGSWSYYPKEKILRREFADGREDIIKLDDNNER